MDVKRKSDYNYEDLLACGHGELFGEGNAQLPLPPMLMFDRISHICKTGGIYGKGEVRAQLDLFEDLWFFQCHFKDDPVMPGCLGLDGLWQLLGFFLGWIGLPGKGRALSVGKVKFSGMVLPSLSKIDYVVNLKQIITRRLILGIADGEIFADGERLYEASDIRVGLFSVEGK